MAVESSTTRLTAAPSAHECGARARLAWRPAWSLRNRRGSIALLLVLWRRWRARRSGHVD